MKSTLTALIYWLAIAGFGSATALIIHRLLGETGVLDFAKLQFGTGQTTQPPRRNRRRTINNLMAGWLGERKPQFIEFTEIFILVLASRILIILVAALALMVLSGGNTGLDRFVSWMWTKWDSGHYLDIARWGYQNTGDQRFFIVFFPLYPGLVRLFALVLHSYEWAGVVVANGSLLIAGLYLYRLVRLDFSRKIARTAVILLLFNPFSFFLGIVYSDSLYLALSIMTFYYLRKAKWMTAGFFGFLASLSRSFGVLLIVPAVIEFLRTTGIFHQIRRKEFSGLTKFKAGLFLLGIPLGFGVYLLINKLIADNWFQFTIYQWEHWCHRYAFFATNLAELFGYLFSAKPSDQIAIWLPEICAVIVTLGLFFYGFRKIRLAYLAYLLLYLLVCLSTTWLISGSRYLMTLFPVYLLLALLLRRRTGTLVAVVTSVSLLAFYTIAFVMDYNVL